MIIGIDASRAVTTRKTGTEHYSEQIIYHISKLDKKNKYILFSETKPSKGSLLDKLPKNFSWKIIPFGYLWTQIRLSWEMLYWKNKLNVLFIPSHTIPLIHPKNTVVTIHDFGFEYEPSLYAKKPIGPNNWFVKNLLNIGARIFTLGKFGNSEYDYHRWAMRKAVKNAKELISVSNFTKNDAVKMYNADLKKITVIYHGFDKKRFVPISKLNNKEQKISFQLTNKYKPYLFFVGRIEKKKNILRLIKAYKILKQKYKIPHKLLLAGMPGLGYEKIEKYILSLNPEIKNDIIKLGYVKDEDLTRYIQNADIFIFPTLFEGFGIPVIEAFACKIPVVCSDTTALLEIAKNYAQLVNPKDVSDIAIKTNLLIKNKKLREKLTKKAYIKSKTYSWKKAAQQTLKVIHKAAN